MPCTWHHFNTRASFMRFREISNFYRKMSNCHAIRPSKLYSLFWWNEIKFSKKVEMEVYLKHLETTILVSAITNFDYNTKSDQNLWSSFNDRSIYQVYSENDKNQKDDLTSSNSSCIEFMLNHIPVWKMY